MTTSDERRIRTIVTAVTYVTPKEGRVCPSIVHTISSVTPFSTVNEEQQRLTIHLKNIDHRRRQHFLIL